MLHNDPASGTMPADSTLLMSLTDPAVNIHFPDYYMRDNNPGLMIWSADNIFLLYPTAPAENIQALNYNMRRNNPALKIKLFEKIEQHHQNVPV